MRFQGKSRYRAQESLNLSLGQAGFNLIATVSEQSNDKGWVAIKAVDGTAQIKARSLTGDAYSSTGVYSSGATIALLESDVIYGAFDRITLGNSSSKVLAYRG